MNVPFINLLVVASMCISVFGVVGVVFSLLSYLAAEDEEERRTQTSLMKLCLLISEVGVTIVLLGVSYVGFEAFGLDLD